MSHQVQLSPAASHRPTAVLDPAARRRAGNAAGDTDMLRAARFALVVHHDDGVREYAYDDPQILNAAAGGGWTVISMRDDFARVWPTDPADDAQ